MVMLRKQRTSKNIDEHEDEMMRRQERRKRWQRSRRRGKKGGSGWAKSTQWQITVDRQPAAAIETIVMIELL